MLQTTPLTPLPVQRFMPLHTTQAPPYSPTLINLNQKFNMSANSLTEALLLLSGMYISLVQPDPGPIKIGIHGVYPKATGGHLAVMNRMLNMSIRQSYNKNNDKSKQHIRDYRKVTEAFNVSFGYTQSTYTPKDVLNMLCEDVFKKNVITLFYINNHISLEKKERSEAFYLPKLLESLKLPIISYDTQFSPNSMPELSIQLAPTMGQMMDVMFAFLKRFDWHDFSFLCTLSYGCQDEISYIRLKIEESQRKPNVSVYGVDMYTYRLLSYVNFTDGTNETEATEKLQYDLHRDSRINLVHGSGSEVMSIMDAARKLNLTGKDYVWIFTSASITFGAYVTPSYPLGSFVFAFESSRDHMEEVVKSGIQLWLEGLNSLAMSSDMDGMDFSTGFSCDRIKEEISGHVSNDTFKSPLEWKYGKILYRYMLQSKYVGGLEIDENGVLKSNKFHIINIQKQAGSSSSHTMSDSDRRTRPERDPSYGGSDSFRPPSGLSDSDQPSVDRHTGFTNPRGGDSRYPDSKDTGRELPDRTDKDSQSRDGQSRNPFSRNRDTPFPRDRDGSSRLPKGREIGSSSSRHRTSDSSANEFPGSGKSQPHAGSSGTFFNDDPSYNAFKDSPPYLLDPRASPQDNNSGVDSRSSFPNLNHVFGSPSSDDETSDSDEDPTKRFAGLSRESMRHKDIQNAHGNRGSHRSYGEGRANTDTWGHKSHYNRSHTIKRRQTRRRFSRLVVERQVPKKIADWDGHNLLIYDVTWPGGASQPPKGKPEKYLLKVVTWQEDPHVIYRDMIPGEKENELVCEVNSVPCTVYNRNEDLHRTNGTKSMCCTGLCIDLLMRIGDKLNFDVQISEVDEGRYGSPTEENSTEWNGMIGKLIRKEADMAIGALSITPERSAVVDFSVPFQQTGITIIVALRHGVISATAFLEPYDYPSWSLILLFSVHATGASIFIFEWLSPYGLDQGKTSYSIHKFSLFRSFWLIWAMLFGASVSTDQPRGMASRFLANIWALFAVVFCASYTANLAAFMITKDTYHDLSGIQDWRLKNPHHVKPPFKFATIANTSTDFNIKKNYKDIHNYMKTEAQTNVKGAIKNLKAGRIEAFIYDSTTLEYEVGKDDGCKLKTVGKRIAETGYGVAFPKRSQWVRDVDRALLQLQESGEIERLQKHWLARACHNKKETGVSSHTLGILNFTSAFVLLGSGIVLGVLILLLEHMYFRFGRKSLKKWDKCGCCSLVSLSMGQSLTFEQSVMEAMDYHKHHRCRDPLCETQLWKVKHDLDIALLKISQLRRQIASSASYEAARGGGYGASSKYDREVSPNQNGSARRRRQNGSDSGMSKMETTANQPLLALEGKSDTDEDITPVQSPSHNTSPNSHRSSFPESKNKAPGKDSGRYSYPEQRHPRENIRRASDDRPSSRMAPDPRNLKTPGDRHRVTDLDFHPPPPTFDEAMSRYKSSPTDDTMTPSPTPPPPSSPPPPPEVPTPPYPSPQGGASPQSDSNPSNSSPSSDGKRYEPFILDSPESPSFSSFSEASDNRLSCPGTLSKLSDEIPSTAVSQDMDSNFTSSPEMSKSLDDTNPFPHVGYAAGSQLSNAHNKHHTSPADNLRPSVVQQAETHPDSQGLLSNSSKEADNDVNTRRTRDNDGNIYVNIDDITGKETAF